MKKRILDAGCGTGEFANSLKKLENEIWGIDISKENISKAKRLFGEKINFRVKALEDLDFKAGFFDEIYCREVLEHVEDLDKTVFLLSKILKKEGKLTVSIPTAKSENVLIRINPGYRSEIGHKRVFNKLDLLKLFKKDFKVISYRRYNSIETIYWKVVFKKGIRIKNQNALLSQREGLILKTIKELLNQDNFFVYKDNNLIYLAKKILFPITKILDALFVNKKQEVTLIKK